MLIGSYRDFWSILNPDIYNDIDQTCGIIRIKGNLKYISLINDSRAFDHPKFDGRLKLLGADPFKTFLNKLFIPVKPILDTVTTINNMFLNFKWMAIHSRGFYETNNQTGRAIECALKLIDRNLIQAIYFATDTTRMLDTATSMIPPKYLYYLNKNLVDDRNGSAIDSFEIRNAMEIALEEWFLIGEAVRLILIKNQFNIFIYMYTKSSLKLTYDHFIN